RGHGDEHAPGELPVLPRGRGVRHRAARRPRRGADGAAHRPLGAAGRALPLHGPRGVRRLPRRRARRARHARAARLGGDPDALAGELPAEFRDVYDALRYRRAQEYTRARARFGLVTSTVGLAVLLAFWFAGGFGWLDRSLRPLGLGPIGTGLLYLGALGLAWFVLGVPFRWWSTFVIDARFGFNRTAPKTFWTDLLKGILLAAVLGGPLVAAVL